MRASHIIAIGLMAIISSRAYGGSIGGGTVDEILNDRTYPGILFVSVTGSKTGAPACDSHSVWEFAVDTSDEQGMLMYTMLLSSLNEGRTVDLFGSNSCDLYSAVETLTRIELR